MKNKGLNWYRIAGRHLTSSEGCRSPKPAAQRQGLRSTPKKITRLSVRPTATEAVKRKLARQVGREIIRIVLHNHELKPRGEKSRRIAELGGECTARVGDVRVLYDKPLSEMAPVLYPDEMPVMPHADLRPFGLIWRSRIPARDCEYERRGTANVFCGMEPKAGPTLPSQL
jgi:hypothetical protein